MVASTFYIRIGPSNKIIYVPGRYICGVHWAHGPNNVISVDFKDSHFEFRVNQELTKSRMDFSVSSLDSSSTKTWVWKPKFCLYLF